MVASRSSSISSSSSSSSSTTPAIAPARAGVRLNPEEKARHVRPLGWVAPGPHPEGPQGDPELLPREGEDLSFLCGDWRLLQLQDGHRWSLDDHLTAVVALQEAGRMSRPVISTLDLGCGIGSVLLMVAWGLPFAKAVGIEAQAISFQLAQRSVRYNLGNGSSRVTVLRGDLRDTLPPEVVPPGGFDLITGTPPYIPPGDGGISERPQKEPCNLETRGGVEGYVAAAAHVLAPDGRFVVVMGVQGQKRRDRVYCAAANSCLAVTRCVEVVPREGKPPLMNVYVLQRSENAAGDAIANHEKKEVFVVRLADGRLSPDMHDARQAIGMPPAKV